MRKVAVAVVDQCLSDVDEESWHFRSFDVTASNFQSRAGKVTAEEKVHQKYG